MRAISVLVVVTALGLGGAPAGAAAQSAAFDPASRAALDPALRASVVRIELAIAPLSAGPSLAEALATTPDWTPYQSELLRRLRMRSVGSGFLVNDRGHVVTNAHVVLSGVRYPGLHLTYTVWDSMARVLTEARDIWVTVGEGSDERTYLAAPVVLAEDLDLAVLEILPPPGEAPRWHYLPIGDSASLQVGQPVCSAGFPDNGFSVTCGELRSLIRGRRVHEDMRIIQNTDPDTGETAATVGGTTPGPVVRLQHTAPTGHGSSGAPLLDSQGHAIGVIYAVLSERPPAGGNGFSSNPELNLAIASNVLRELLTRHAIPFTEGAP